MYAFFNALPILRRRSEDNSYLVHELYRFLLSLVHKRTLVRRDLLHVFDYDNKTLYFRFQLKPLRTAVQIFEFYLIRFIRLEKHAGLTYYSWLRQP